MLIARRRNRDDVAGAHAASREVCGDLVGAGGEARVRPHHVSALHGNRAGVLGGGVVEQVDEGAHLDGG